jgi:N4-gp56 family major capsid protein
LDYLVLSDFLDMTTIDPYKTELAEMLGDQMGDTLDQLTKAVLVATTTIQYASTATTKGTIAAGMIMTGDEVRKAVRTLQGNNAKPVTEMIDPTDGFNTSPIMPAFIGIIDQSTHYDLKKDPDWVKVAEYADPEERIHEAEVGALDEVRFILAPAGGTGAPTGSGASISSGTGSGGIDVHQTLILGKEAYGITRVSGEAVKVITKELGTGGTVDPLDQRSTMGWKATFVAKILQQNFMIVINHAVSS